MEKRKILAVALGLIIIFSGSQPSLAYGLVYEGEDYRLEKYGTDVYLSTDYPLVEGGYIYWNIYRIKNVSRVLDPINYKIHFDGGAGASGTDLFPHLEIDGPLEIESLRDDIFFDTHLYRQEGRNFKGTDISFYMDGRSKYLVYEEAGGQEELSIRTGEVRDKKKEWEEEGKAYLHAGYEKGGRIYSKDGGLTYKNKKEYYSHFLLRGRNWRDQKELPRVFISFAGEEESKKSKFTDVKEDSWYIDYINRLVESGGVKGYKDGSFRPNEKISLAEFLKMAISSVTGEEYETEDPNHWAMGIYDFALSEGIIRPGDFSRSKEDLDRKIKREDMAYIVNNIDRNLRTKGNPASRDIGIEDIDSISPDRKEAVLEAYSKGLIKGREKGFEPKALTTRAEATTVVVRLLDR